MNNRIILIRIILMLLLVLFPVLMISGCTMARTKNPDGTSFLEEKETTLKKQELKFDENIFGEYGNSQAGMMEQTSAILYGGYYTFTLISEGKSRTYYLDENNKANLFCFDDSCTHTGSCNSKKHLYFPHYYNGDLYMSYHFRIYTLNGKREENVYVNDDYIENFTMRDGKFYFSDSKGICSVDMETKEKVYITDLLCTYFSLNVYNDKIYFCTPTYQLYSINFDGSELTLLTNDKAFLPQCHDGCIYYRRNFNSRIEENELMCLNLETGDNSKIATNIYHMSVCNDAIYYVGAPNARGDAPLYKYIYSSNEIKELGIVSVYNFIVYDEFDYIVSFYYEVENAGTMNEKLIAKPFLMDKNTGERTMIELPLTVKE